MSYLCQSALRIGYKIARVELTKNQQKTRRRDTIVKIPGQSVAFSPENLPCKEML